jgi:hypothetical protein
MLEVKRNLTRIRPASEGREVRRGQPSMTSGVIQRMGKKEKLGGIN